MKKPIIVILISMSTHVNAQNVEPKFDFRFGIGTSLLGSGDMRTVMIQNELNYFIHDYFSTSISAGYGRSNSGAYESSSFVQGNLNIYLSPFTNKKKNDFRIGTGISCINISDVYLESADYDHGILMDEDYRFDNRSSVGMNIILENTYSVTDKIMLGLKLFTQQYKNGDVNSGLMLKLGLKI